ncbi:hypothetical protein KP509_19G006500 [Ceratopteris richardii]|uniref:F-box domain-containing protein n=1 Tax=Ceratopteris richardii TaxID=49495 RepID=A0A8T2SJI8_CERRI|nr:hypothetical protein KP509_19G006500 [Ceratopteris richardii]
MNPSNRKNYNRRPPDVLPQRSYLLPATIMSDPELIPHLPFDIALECFLRLPLYSLSTLPQVCRSWRSVLSSPSFFETRRVKGHQTNLACMILASPSAGSSKSPVYSVSIYDQKQDTWAVLPAIPDLPEGVPLFCSCVAVGTQLVLLGGWDPSSWSASDSVYIYDFVQARWRRGAPMPTARSFFACAAEPGGRIVIAGGHDDNKNALRSAEVYDISADAWETLPDMNEERDECKAICCYGKVLIVSGFPTQRQGQFVASAESYDFQEKKWEVIDNFWPEGKPPSSIVSLDDQPYALLDGQLARRKASEGVWQSVAAVPDAVKISAAVTVLSDGILIIGFGGSTQPMGAVRWRAGGAASWESVAVGEGNLSIVHHRACTVQV